MFGPCNFELLWPRLACYKNNGHPDIFHSPKSCPMLFDSNRLKDQKECVSWVRQKLRHVYNLLKNHQSAITVSVVIIVSLFSCVHRILPSSFHTMHFCVTYKDCWFVFCLSFFALLVTQWVSSPLQGTPSHDFIIVCCCITSEHHHKSTVKQERPLLCVALLDCLQSSDSLD